MKLTNVPNIITISRFLLIPIICFCITENSIFSFILFVLAAVSDFFDGYLARKMKCESKFGAFFDNIADKMLTISVVCILLRLQEIWVLPCVIVICREVFIASFREYVAKNSNSRIEVEMFGKIKTLFQFVSLSILIFPIGFIECNTNLLGNIIFAISAVLSICSGLYYFMKYFLKK